MNRLWALLVIPALLLAVVAVVNAQQGMCPPICPCGCVYDPVQGQYCCADCGGGGGGGGEYPPPPVEPPPPQPPPGSTPPPGGVIPPVPTPTPDPNLDCFDCYPWAFCPDHRAHVCFLGAGNTYYLISVDCMSSEQCNEEEPPPREPPVELPCIPTWDGETFSCESTRWGYLINVRAAVPPARVQVRPFPRWIVGMGCLTDTPFQSGQPGSLTLQDYPRYTPPELCAPNGPGFSAGCWSNTVDFPQRPEGAEPQAGDIRNYQIGLRWRRVRLDQPHANDIGAVPPVCWDFDERAWNIGQDFGCGPVPAGECGSTMVTHVYETSSWGKPTNGPNFVSLPCGDTPYCC